MLPPTAQPSNMNRNVAPSWITFCDRCRKVVFKSRKDAKGFAKAKHPGEHKAAYACPAGRGWHIGALPHAVVVGRMARESIWRRTDFTHPIKGV